MRSLVGYIGMALGCGNVLISGAAHAQNTADAGDRLEEIIVTAERRTSDIQKAATSVSARSGESLQEQGKYSLEQIIEDIPGITAAAGQSLGGTDVQGNNVTIRSVSGNPGGGNTAISPIPATAVYTDGIYEGLGGNYDIERVEVLRGPQGTLYGRSATSGVLAIHTRNPSFDGFGGNVSAEWGSYGLQHYSGAVNVPVGDTFALRVAADRHYRGEGYYNGEAGESEKISGRVKMLWQPGENLSILLGTAFEENDQHNGGISGSSPALDTIVYSSAPVRSGHDHARQYWAEINWDLGGATLTWQPALRTWHQDDDQWVAGPGRPPGGMDQFIDTPFDQFHTQELRLSSNEDSRLQWQAGVFYYDNRVRNSNVSMWISSGALIFDNRTEKQTNDYGLFSEAIYAFTDATRLTVGARYDDTRVESRQVFLRNLNYLCGVTAGPCPAGSTGIGLPENRISLSLSGDAGISRFYNFNYKARIEHDLTPDNLFYAMVSTGFLPGDVRIGTNAANQLEATPFASETLTAYELGSKNRFLDDTLQVNVGAFYYRYGGFQTSINRVQGDASTAYYTTVPARMWGGELEVLYQLTPRDRVGLSYGSLESIWVDKPADFARDQPQKHRPVTPHTVNANYEHVFHLPGGSTLSARADATFLSSRRLNNYTPTLLAQGASAYAYADREVTGNVNAAWRSSGGRYSVTAYVRNVGDHTRITYQISTLVPRSVTASETDPRTYGVVLSARF